MTESTDMQNAVAQNAVIFSVSIGAMGLVRKLNSSVVETDSDPTMVKAQKVLLDAPEIDAINRLDGQIRLYVASMSLPGPMRRGLYLVPLSLLESVDAQMSAFRDRREALVTALIEVYEQRVREARLKLRTNFRSGDYPSSSALRFVYRFSWQYTTLGVPSALPPEIAEREKEKLQAMWQETAELGRELLLTSMSKLVRHFQERLSGSAQRWTVPNAVENVNLFLDSFNARNITSDSQLKTQADRLRALLKSLDINGLKESVQLRDQVATSFAQIEKDLDSMIAARPRVRGFRE